MMRPTVAAWLAIPAYVVTVDAWLIKRGHLTLSALARQHRAAAVSGAALLAAHFWQAWRYDPLHMLGEYSRRRTT